LVIPCFGMRARPKGRFDEARVAVV
jgi:hypothetical protein